MVTDIAFYGLVEAGDSVLKPGSGVFQIDPATTSNITFHP
jgi:hypothetical protein